MNIHIKINFNIIFTIFLFFILKIVAFAAIGVIGVLIKIGTSRPDNLSPTTKLKIDARKRENVIT
jgi:hypothetical protein